MTIPDKELLPCPFCGGKAKHMYQELPFTKWRHLIVCTNTTCGAEGSCCASKHDAAEYWNRRVGTCIMKPTPWFWKTYRSTKPLPTWPLIAIVMMRTGLAILAAILLTFMFWSLAHAQGTQSPRYSPEQLKEMHRQYCVTMSAGKPDRAAWIERCLAER